MSDDIALDPPEPNRGPHQGKPQHEPSERPYEVGYGKPPREHQFKKGEPSPNKYGRGGKPGKRKKLIKPRSHGEDVTGELAKEYLIREIYRPVKVREDGKTIELPALQAMLRAQIVSAMKGNRIAATFLINQTQAIEAERGEHHIEYILGAERYKREAQQILSRARRQGLPEPEILPHPDDLIIDDNRNVVIFAGPTNKQEKVRWDRHLRNRDSAQWEVSFCARAFRWVSDPAKKARWREEWLYAQHAFDQLNDNLPHRYRKRLRHRCTDLDASQPGSKKRIDWPEF